MPALGALGLKNFRNWSQLRFSPYPGINLLVGDNGSGKTSILEAILFVCRGSSFRARRNYECIRYQQEVAGIESSWKDPTDEFLATAVLLATGESKVSVQGKRVRRRVDLLTRLPVVFVAPHNLDLIGASPAFRRAFLNAISLHLIPGYARLFSDYTKCLAARNIRLTHRPKDYALMLSWDKTLSDLGEKLEKHRKELVLKLIKAFWEFPAIKDGPTTHISYARGWSEDLSLADALRQRFDQDVRHGFSTVGCHRADLMVYSDDVRAVQRLSLGQSYLVSLALFLAARHLLQAALNTKTLFLLDDIIQRFDRSNLSLICDFIRQNEIQAFLTTSEHLSYWKKEETDAVWQIADQKLNLIH